MANLNAVNWPFQLDELPFGSALVGGAIRDGLLNIHNPRKDLDFVVSDNAINLTKKLASKLGGRAVELDSQRDVGRLIQGDWTVDFAAQVGNSLEEDLYRRDYTVNAIALIFSSTSESKLIDPTGGISDLRKKILVPIKKKNLIDDPLRLLRGLRLLAEFNFSLDKETLAFLSKNANLLELVSPERIKSEVERLIQAPWADKAIDLLNQTNLLRPWQRKKRKSSFYFSSLSDFSYFLNDELEIALPLARLNYLLSNYGLVELRFSRKKSQICNLLSYWQSRNDGFAFKSLNETERFRLHKDLEAYLPALILDLPSPDQEVWLDRWRDPLDPLFHPSSPLDGVALQQAFGAPQGPWIGLLIDFLSKEKAFGRLQNSEDAFELARYWYKQNQPFCD